MVKQTELGSLCLSKMEESRECVGGGGVGEKSGNFREISLIKP